MSWECKRCDTKAPVITCETCLNKIKEKEISSCENCPHSRNPYRMRCYCAHPDMTHFRKGGRGVPPEVCPLRGYPQLLRVLV